MGDEVERDGVYVLGIISFHLSRVAGEKNSAVLLGTKAASASNLTILVGTTACQRLYQSLLVSYSQSGPVPSKLLPTCIVLVAFSWLKPLRRTIDSEMLMINSTTSTSQRKRLNSATQILVRDRRGFVRLGLWMMGFSGSLTSASWLDSTSVQDMYSSSSRSEYETSLYCWFFLMYSMIKSLLGTAEMSKVW